jgi:hypothetical protein
MRKTKQKKMEKKNKPYCPDGINRYANKSEYKKAKKQKSE